MKLDNDLIEPKYSKKDLKWSILLLFGCFCIGWNVANVLHELGHAFAMALVGVPIKEFVLNPFSWCWTFAEYQKYSLLLSLGGVTFGLLFVILPSFAAIWIRSAYFRIPAFTIAAWALSMDGIYLLTGALFSAGDGKEIVEFGAPYSLVIFLGCLYLMLALFMFGLIHPLVGIGKNSSITKRFLIFGAAVFPYLLMIFLYNFILNRREILLWTSFVLGGVVLIWMSAVAGYFWARIGKGFDEINRTKIGWKPVIIFLIIGFIIIAGEFLIFGIHENPFGK
ncbi:MAG: hypothetical protein EHM93_08125 [Bacteroidales bacterium]|nr:MAG: hypothetical protein EHM93_08125 [Bacteroidales bacterium]